MTRDEVDALESVFAAWRNHGTDRVVKELRQHPFSEHAAAILQPDDKRAFYRNVMFLKLCYIRSAYAAERMVQLSEGGFSQWIYHTGDCETHRIWDGLVLPAGHDFWATHAPPNGPGCECYVIGARSEAGARRQGGNSERILEPDWRARFPVAVGFEGPPPFSFVTCLLSLIAHQRDTHPDRA